MVRKFITGLAVMTLMACGAKTEKQAAADSLKRDLELAAAESTTAINDQPAPAAAPAAAPTPAPAATKPKPVVSKPAAPKVTSVTLASGSEVTASANDSLHSRHNKVGESFHASVSSDVRDGSGRVVIPAGSVVTFRLTKIQHANNTSDKDGELTLQAEDVTIGSQNYPIAGSATQNTVEHTLQGQGVTAGAAARVGAGGVGGAVVGKVIGGKTGAIIGGIAGAAGGAVVAAKTADRDIVVQPGAKVTFVLSSDFTVTR